MAITVVFDVQGMTSDQYDTAMRRLEQAGEGSPEGRLQHVASKKQGGWFVVDVWESPETLDRFAQKLMPVLQEVGVTPPQPQVLETHNLVS